MEKKAVTPEEVKSFIQDNLTYINRLANEIEWVDKNGCNMETGYANDVYTAINKAILDERKTEMTDLNKTKQEPRSGLSDLTVKLEALRKLALRDHYYCEDSWYSCPKAEDGCANDANGDDCMCGAEDHNAKVEMVFAEAMKASNVEVRG